VWWGSASGRLGLIAGQGDFPLLFAKAASSLKKKVVVFGFQGYTDKKVEDYAAETHYFELGTLDQLFESLRRLKIKQVVLAGGIPKRQIYNPDFALDETAKSFIQSNAHKGDDHLLKAFGLFLKARCGASVVDSRVFLKDILAPKGVLTRRRPTEQEKDDIKFGWRIVKGIGKMDIGQTVVVKQGVVVAVEALEGTDAAIKRAGSLAHGGGVVVKVAKPNQDLRFDLPCVGRDTLASMKEADISVLVVEAGKTLMLYKQDFLDDADQKNFCIVGV